MTATTRPESADKVGRWDGVLTELHALRTRCGEPSYAELTRRVIEQRIKAGLDPHAAHISKSSVHDAFRMGRTRINLSLTRELVQALGADPALLEQWLVPQPGPPATAPADRPEDQPAVRPATRRPRRTHAAALMLACLTLNLIGREFVDFFAFPIYLDMAGTAVAAIALGPWRGVAVGLSTNVVGILGSGLISLPFALVNIVGALVWGYGVRRLHLGSTLPRFMLLNLIAALACSATAVPILIATSGGQLRAGHDAITLLVQETLGSTVAAVALSNVLTSGADKLISGFVALVLISALPAYYRRHVASLTTATAPPGTVEPGQRQPAT